MDALSTDTLREIVRRVFPDLQYGGDPDLERYFEFRSEGRLGEALAIYNGPLRARYPDDASRVLLLRLYRERDPRWLELQERLALDLGRRLALRLGRNIDILVAPLERADLANAFKALSAVEALLARLPKGEDAAIGFLDRYVDFARVLRYRQPIVARARDLVAEYLAMAKSDAPGETDFMARSAAIEEKRRAEEAQRRAAAGPQSSARAQSESFDFMAQSEVLEERRREAEEKAAKARFFDLSRIEFSEADRARIEIKQGLERREDRVLAYCWKYWELVYDPSFERLVFLYSKKYGSEHYSIFRTIKGARLRRFTDDEILTAVSTLLSSSYSYSVSGDLYMQATWRRLKARAEAEKAAAIEAQAERALAKDAPKTPSVQKEVARRPDIRAARKAPAPEPAIRSNFAARGGAPEIRSRLAERNAVPVLKSRFIQPSEDLALRSRLPAASDAPALRSNFSQPSADAALRSRPADPEPRAEIELRSRPSGGEERPAEERIERAEPKADARADMLLAARRESAEREQARIEERISARAAKAERREEAQAPKAEQPEAPKPAPRKAALTRVAGESRRAHGAQLLGQAPRAEALPAISVHGGSVSDRIKKLSGKAYDVYREIFIDGVRESIHRHLLANQTRPHRFFDEAPNQAEDLIFNFMADRYEDPYLDWESSDERKRVDSLGFNVPSIDPIIEAWFRKL